MRTRLVLGLALVAASAAAEVRHQGAWPDGEKQISLELEHTPRRDAVKELADRAGWSVVAQGVSDDPIDVHVKDQPPSKVLDVLLDDGKYTADRDGTMISIRTLAGAPEVASVAPPAPPPAATVRGEDRKVTGGNLRIEKGETVHNVSVVGGNLEIFGTVTGEVSVMGGNVRVRDGAHVVGHVTSAGGNVDIDDGAIVDGDVGVVGGALHRGERSKIGGAIEIGDHEHGGGVIQRIGDVLMQAALLFVFGAVMFSLMGKRMEALQGEVAARPMRSFALGILGGLGFGVTLLALLVTIVGIPVAIAIAIGGVLAMYASICAVLATAGRALLHHKSESPYVHLALGCALFVVASHLPVVGGFVTLVVGLMGIGALVSTRVGGLWPGKAPAQGPYRTAT